MDHGPWSLWSRTCLKGLIVPLLKGLYRAAGISSRCWWQKMKRRIERWFYQWHCSQWYNDFTFETDTYIVFLSERVAFPFRISLENVPQPTPLGMCYLFLYTASREEEQIWKHLQPDVSPWHMHRAQDLARYSPYRQCICFDFSSAFWEWPYPISKSRLQAHLSSNYIHGWTSQPALSHTYCQGWQIWDVLYMHQSSFHWVVGACQPLAQEVSQNEDISWKRAEIQEGNLAKCMRKAVRAAFF